MITERFNEIVSFIVQCNVQGGKDSPEFKKKCQKLLKSHKKSEAKRRIKQLEMQIEEQGKSTLPTLDDWILQGIRTWIRTFMPNRINLRLYPFEACPSFQILANLKRDCFVDQDLEHLLYGFGPRPNIHLSIFGLITSLPPKGEHPFDPLKEFQESSAPDDKAQLELGFRQLFGGLDELEDFVRYSRYPNVTVHPIAGFREFNVKNGNEVAPLTTPSD